MSDVTLGTISTMMEFNLLYCHIYLLKDEKWDVHEVKKVGVMFSKLLLGFN